MARFDFVLYALKNQNPPPLIGPLQYERICHGFLILYYFQKQFKRQTNIAQKILLHIVNNAMGAWASKAGLSAQRLRRASNYRVFLLSYVLSANFFLSPFFASSPL